MRLGSQVAAALKQKKQLMDAVELMKLIQSVNFSSLMGIPDAELVSFGMKEGVVTKHKVTPYFCRRDSQGSHMSAGVVTALFDEISTMDVILQDRTHRPGVSVTLHVDMFDTTVDSSAAPGTTLHLRSWAHKIGATLGFLAMRLEDHSGNLVATGSHVKFLPSPYGRAWDLCFHPLVYPLLRTRLKSMVQPHVAKGETVSIDHDHGSIYDHFPLHDLHLAPLSPLPSAQHQHAHTTLTTIAAAEAEGKEPSPSTSPLPATAATTATFKVQPRHCNGFFSLHGGALATITEDLALRDATHRLTSTSSRSRTATPTHPNHPSATPSHTHPSSSPSSTPPPLTPSSPSSSPPPPSSTPPVTHSSPPPPLRTQSVSITYLAANPNGATVNLAAATPVDPHKRVPGGPVVSHVDVFGRGGKLTNQAVFVLREQHSAH